MELTMNDAQKDTIFKLLGTVMPNGIVKWKKIFSDDLRITFMKNCNINVAEGVYGVFDEITIYLVKTVYQDVRIIISINGTPMLIPSDTQLDTAAEYLYMEIDRRILRETNVYTAVVNSLMKWKNQFTDMDKPMELLDIRDVLNISNIEKSDSSKD